MRKLVLSLIFLIGLFAFSCTAPPDKVFRPEQPTEYAQVVSVDQVMQADFVSIGNHVVLPSPDTPAPAIGTAEFILKENANFVFKDFGLKLFTVPPLESQCIQFDRYKLIAFFVPDKSNKDSRHERAQKLL